MNSRVPVALAAASVTLLAALAGCGDPEPQTEIGTIRTEPLPQPEPELRPVEPVTAADCPYLTVVEASDVGAVPVTEVRIDESHDPAACVFYGADGAVVLTTTLYTVDSAERAAELVLESAPGSEDDRITVEGGWTGGGTEVPGGELVVLARGERILAVQTVTGEIIPGEEGAEGEGAAQAVAGVIGPRLAG